MLWLYVTMYPLKDWVCDGNDWQEFWRVVVAGWRAIEATGRVPGAGWCWQRGPVMWQTQQWAVM